MRLVDPWARHIIGLCSLLQSSVREHTEMNDQHQSAPASLFSNTLHPSIEQCPGALACSWRLAVWWLKDGISQASVRPRDLRKLDA